jgi:hypothetical protein
MLIVVRMCVYYYGRAPKRALICDGGFVELPYGIGTELPWRLRYLLGAPTLHSLSTVSHLRPWRYSKDWKLMGPGFLHRYHTGEYSHRPGILDLPTDCSRSGLQAWLQRCLRKAFAKC